MECCSSTSSSDYEEDLESVCAILAADTVTVRRKVWVHDINMKRKEKAEFLHLVNPLTPNDHYSGRNSPLTSKRCILYIFQQI